MPAGIALEPIESACKPAMREIFPACAPLGAAPGPIKSVGAFPPNKLGNDLFVLDTLLLLLPRFF